MPATQFNMKWVEQAGLVKFDFLGLKTLTQIDNAVNLIRKTRDLHVAADGTRLYDPAQGTENDILGIPLDDARTYELYARARVAAVFQVEVLGHDGRAQADAPHLHRGHRGPRRSLPPRPHGEHSRLLRGQERHPPLESLHPSIDPILKETQGIIVYQEQVMEIAQVMAGLFLGGADLLRRAMGKKIPEEMAKERPKFIAGAKSKGVTDKKAGEVFDLLRSSPTTASTSPTPRPMRWSATRPPGSRRTIRRVHGRRHELRPPHHRQARLLLPGGAQVPGHPLVAALREPLAGRLRRAGGRLAYAWARSRTSGPRP
jgi:hypothetical protein